MIGRVAQPFAFFAKAGELSSAQHKKTASWDENHIPLLALV
jgi:hypothetical protein